MTADGEVKIANACSNPDLFWALKGGGGGFGVVTRVTLRTHPLPEFFGGVFATVKATSDDAYRRLIAKTVEFYAQALFNPHWGEQILIGRGFVAISMVFQGLTSNRRRRCGVRSSIGSPLRRRISPRVARRGSAPCRRSISGTRRCSSSLPGLRHRRRSRGRAGGQYLLGRKPRTRRARSGTPTNPPGCRLRSSKPTSAESFVDALVRGREASGVALHCNKGLAGATGGRNRRGEGYGDESSGHRRFRAGDHRRTGRARLSRRSRAMSRTRRPRERRRRPSKRR